MLRGCGKVIIGKKDVMRGSALKLRRLVSCTALLVSMSWLLAACGAQPAGNGQAAAPSALPSAAAPTSTAAPAPEATEASVPTAIATPAAPEPTEAVAAAGPFADIPQGVTPEGYQFLGDPAAPATLVMYSDFL